MGAQVALTLDGNLQHASRVRPCPGHEVGGDAVVIRQLEDGLFVAIVDVLGHGPEAHELTRLIDAYLTRYGSADVAGLMQRLHDYLRGTRGAAVGLCAIDAGTGRLGASTTRGSGTRPSVASAVPRRASSPRTA